MPLSGRQLISIARLSIGLLSGQRRVSPAKRLRNTVLSVEMLLYRTYCHVSLPEFSPISVMTSWPAWAAMAGGHNRRGSTEGVGHARRSWNAVRDDYPRPSLAESAARALPFPKSQRPTCPFSFAPGGTPPAPYGPPRHPPLPGVILFWRIRCYLGRPAGHLRPASSIEPALELALDHGPVTSGRAGTAAEDSVRLGQGHPSRTAFWPWSARPTGSGREGRS